jgi:hypothetical protein
MSNQSKQLIHNHVNTLITHAANNKRPISVSCDVIMYNTHFTSRYRTISHCFSKWPLRCAVTVWTEALVPSVTHHNSLDGLQVANGRNFIAKFVTVLMCRAQHMHFTTMAAFIISLPYRPANDQTLTHYNFAYYCQYFWYHHSEKYINK